MDRVTTSWSKQWGGRNCQLLCEIFWVDRICVDKQMFVNAEIVYLRRFKSGIQWKIEGGSSQLNKQRLRFRRTSFVTLDVTWCRRNLFLFVAGPRQLFHLSWSSWIRVLVPLSFCKRGRNCFEWTVLRNVRWWSMESFSFEIVYHFIFPAIY